MSVNLNPVSFFKDYVSGAKSVEYDANLAMKIVDGLAMGQVPTEDIAALIQDKVSDKQRNIILGAATFVTTALGLSKGVAPRLINKFMPKTLANASYVDLAAFVSKNSKALAEKLSPLTSKIMNSELTKKVADSSIAKTVSDKGNLLNNKIKNSSIFENASKFTPEMLGNNPVSKFLGLEKPANLVGLGLISVPAGFAAKNVVNNVADSIDADLDTKNDRQARSFDYTI